MALYGTKQYGEATEAARKAIEVRQGNVFGWIVLIASLAQLGKIGEAAARLADFKHLKPDFSAAFLDRYPFRRDVDRQHYFDALAKVGLPD